MGTSKLLGQPNKMLHGRDLRWTSIPPRGSSDRRHAAETGISSAVCANLAPNGIAFKYVYQKENVFRVSTSEVWENEKCRGNKLSK